VDTCCVGLAAGCLCTSAAPWLSHSLRVCVAPRAVGLGGVDRGSDCALADWAARVRGPAAAAAAAAVARHGCTSPPWQGGILTTILEWEETDVPGSMDPRRRLSGASNGCCGCAAPAVYEYERRARGTPSRRPRRGRSRVRLRPGGLGGARKGPCRSSAPPPSPLAPRRGRAGYTATATHEPDRPMGRTRVQGSRTPAR
jgi:hypothetical protein